MITFDFGNTLCPVPAAGLASVVAALAEAVAEPYGVDREAFLAAWREERNRQFREEVPRFREADLVVRLGRVLARLRGAGPGPGERWNDEAAGLRSTPTEIALGVEVYARAFVAGLPPEPWIEPFLGRLAGRARLAILSNWPLAASIDAYVEAAGWARHLSAVVVSQRVGMIKPDPGIFRAAEAALAAAAAERGEPTPRPDEILHVGDDWAADVVGAKRAGWRAAWLNSRPVDSPLPDSEPDGSVEADLVLARLADLEGALVRGAGTGGPAFGKPG